MIYKKKTYFDGNRNSSFVVTFQFRLRKEIQCSFLFWFGSQISHKQNFIFRLTQTD